LVQAAAGRWEGARHDLRQCRRRLGRDDLPGAVPAYGEWLARANASTAEYLYATRGVLDYLPGPGDLRVRLCPEGPQRRGGAAPDGLQPDQVRDMKGWLHFTLAQASAQQEDRGGVLRHLREALRLRVPGLTPQACRDDATLSAWNEDKEFVALYGEFEKP